MWLGLMLLCLVSSCSKDDGLPPVTIEGMYEESQTLQYQTPDSIENFAAKFYGYLEVHPDACNHPYYGAIDNKIYELSSQGVMVNTDWDGEIFKEFTNKTDDSKELRKGGRYTDD